MPPGMETGHIVLDGDPAPHSKGHSDLREIYTEGVWSLARTSLKVNVKVTRDKNGIFGPFGGLCAVYVW